MVVSTLSLAARTGHVTTARPDYHGEARDTRRALPTERGPVGATKIGSI